MLVLPDVPQGGNKGTIAITVRQLEAIIRLTESLAKMHFRSLATREDVEEAIRLFRVSTMDAISSGLQVLGRPGGLWRGALEGWRHRGGGGGYVTGRTPKPPPPHFRNPPTHTNCEQPKTWVAPGHCLGLCRPMHRISRPPPYLW